MTNFTKFPIHFEDNFNRLKLHLIKVDMTKCSHKSKILSVFGYFFILPYFHYYFIFIFILFFKLKCLFIFLIYTYLYSKSLGPRFIVEGDFNAMHPLWGSRRFNPKDRELFKSVQINKLHHLSTGEPIYWPSGINKMPDIIDFMHL